MVKLVIQNVNTKIVGSYDLNPSKSEKIHEAIRKELSYSVPAAEWSPAFKEGRWDGTISLYYKRNQTFPTGLTSRVTRVLKENNVEFTLSDQRTKPEADYPLTCDFKGKTLRFYQTAAGDTAAKYQRGVISAATGAGKTMLSCYILSQIKVRPVVFIVPSIDLLTQTQKEFEGYLRLNGETIKVGMAGDNVYDLNHDGINIVTYQTALAAFGEKYQEKGSKIVSISDPRGSRIKTTKGLEDDVEKAKELLQSAKARAKDNLRHLKNELDNCSNELISVEQSPVDTKDKKAHATWLKECKRLEKNLSSKKRAYDKELKLAVGSAQQAYDKALSALNKRHKAIENKASLRNLIENCSAFIVDEAHVAAVVIECLGQHASKAYYRIGLSVAAESFVELKGGPFNGGWVGTIEEAYNILSQSQLCSTICADGGYEIIKPHHEEVYSRGWLNTGGFGWKPIKSFIRHKNTKPLKVFRAGGDFLSLTDDHSIFKAMPDNDGKSNIVSCRSEDIKQSDILVCDDGSNWLEHNQFDIDMIKVIEKSPNKSKIICHFSNDETKTSFNKQIKSQNGLQFVDKLSFNGLSCDTRLKISDFSFLLGLYIGCGWITDNSVSFAIHKDNIEGFMLNFKNLEHMVSRMSISPILSDIAEIKIESWILSDIFKYWFGESNQIQKRLPPECIMSWPLEDRKRILNGIQESCGYSVKSICSVKLNSHSLARDVLALLRSCGIKGMITCLDSDLSEPNEFGVNYIDSQDNNEGYLFIEAPVKDVEEEVSNSQWVYDFEMHDHPSFVANGFLVHNSATPWREDNQEVRIEGALGKKIFEITASDLIDLGYLVPPMIYMIRINHVEHADDYADVYYKHVTNCWERNWRIKQCAESFKDSGRPVLILVERREHGEILEGMIKDAVFVPGGDKGEADPTDEEKNYRRRMLNKVEANEIILIATQWANVGIDAPAISTLILAGSGQSSVTTYQQIGRVLRCVGKDAQQSAENGKPDAIVIDFMDEQKSLRKHSLKRKKVYKRERAFTFKVIN